VAVAAPVTPPSARDRHAAAEETGSRRSADWRGQRHSRLHAIARSRAVQSATAASTLRAAGFEPGATVARATSDRYWVFIQAIPTKIEAEEILKKGS